MTLLDWTIPRGDDASSWITAPKPLFVDPLKTSRYFWDCVCRVRDNFEAKSTWYGLQRRRGEGAVGGDACGKAASDSISVKAKEHTYSANPVSRCGE